MKHIIHTTLMALLLWACLPAPLAAQKRNTTKGKKTVVATEIALAPIRPTTAGFKPDMQPLTVLLDLNFSKH